MIIEIGIVAGEIWHYLDEHSKSSLNDIVSGVEKERDLVLMSVGWLAREGYVIVEGHGPENYVRLREKKQST